MQDNNAGTKSRILPDDELIDLPVTLGIMGGPSVSSAYEDEELMALKISMSPPGRRTRRIRFIKREVLALRAQRVALATAAAPNVQAQVQASVELRRARQRERKTAGSSATGSTSS
jgi:hypothetical protein